MPWAPVPNPTPLPLGEGGRRPGEGPQSTLLHPSVAVGTGLLATRCPLTPTLSQRERGSEAGQLAMGTRPKSNPSPSGRGVAEGRVRVPNHPATPVRCRWDQPTCHEVSPHPVPLPEGEGVGGWAACHGHPSQIQPLSLWERVAEGRVRVPNHPATPVRCRWDRPTCHEVSPHPNPLPEGEGVGGWAACHGHPSQIQPLSLWERVAEGRVRVPNHPATPVRCRWDRPTCHEVPSPRPSPRGRGGRRARPPRPCIERPISTGRASVRYVSQGS